MISMPSWTARCCWALSLALLVSSTAGLSTGAASCDAGQAAVGGLHLSGEVTTGLLQDYGLEVLLDGKALSSSAATDFVVGIDHSLTIQSTSGDIFRGLLFRLGAGEGGVDTTEALAVAPESEGIVQVASPVCTSNGAGGLTQVNNLEKTEAAGILRMDATDRNMLLDVTVVVQNRSGISTYYYSQFALNGVEGDGTVGANVEAQAETQAETPAVAAETSDASRILQSGFFPVWVFLSAGLWKFAL